MVIKFQKKSKLKKILNKSPISLEEVPGTSRLGIDGGSITVVGFITEYGLRIHKGKLEFSAHSEEIELIGVDGEYAEKIIEKLVVLTAYTLFLQKKKKFVKKAM